MDADTFKRTLRDAFDIEAQELLEQIQQLLQQEWSDASAKELFRHFHSLKGTSQLLDYENFAKAASTAELLAATGTICVREELENIYRYLAETLTHIRQTGSETSVYDDSQANSLFSRIAAAEITAQQEQQALFQLFSNHISTIDTLEQKSQRVQLKKLQRAADLMNLQDLHKQLADLNQPDSPLAANLSQTLLTILQSQASFGKAFINFHQRADV